MIEIVLVYELNFLLATYLLYIPYILYIHTYIPFIHTFIHTYIHNNLG